MASPHGRRSDRVVGRWRDASDPAGRPLSGPPRLPAPAWSILAALAAAKLAVHLLSSGPLAYGYMTDELYYLDCTRHLAWGYVDHPPLSVAVLWLVRLVLGESLPALRFLPALAGAATVAAVGLLARQLGGGRLAQGLAALAALIAPVYLAVGGFYSMNAFEPLLWALVAYRLLRLEHGEPSHDRRHWLSIGVLLGLGMQNKLSALWLGSGILFGLLLTPQRRRLRTPWPWCAAAVALVLASPYAIWEAANGWPTAEFARNAAHLKMAAKSPLRFAAEQVMILHPLAAPVWLAGLCFYFVLPAGRRYRFLGWAWVAVFLLLAAGGSARSNYLGPAYVVLLPAGAVVFETVARARAWRRLPRLAAATLAAGGALTAPMALDLVPPRYYAAYQSAFSALGLSPPRDQVDELGVLPLHLALRFHPAAVLDAFVRAMEKVPADERGRVGIFTPSFGEAATVNVLGSRLGLPHAISGHNNYWLWGPAPYDGAVMLVLAESAAELQELYEQVEVVAPLRCAYCMPQLATAQVYLCRKPRRPLLNTWPALKRYV